MGMDSSRSLLLALSRLSVLHVYIYRHILCVYTHKYKYMHAYRIQMQACRYNTVVFKHLAEHHTHSDVHMCIRTTCVHNCIHAPYMHINIHIRRTQALQGQDNNSAGRADGRHKCLPVDFQCHMACIEAEHGRKTRSACRVCCETGLCRLRNTSLLHSS